MFYRLAIFKKSFTYRPLRRLFEDRPHIFPAGLGQRFSAAILDIGFLIFALIGLNLAYKYLNGIPIEFSRPRYRPPEPDMGWGPILRSLAVSGGLMTAIAAFTASPLRATPGMAAFYLRAAYKDGSKLSFPRAFAWALTAYLPLLIANYLILFGIVAGYPVIHAYTFNLFSLMILLQSLWFLTALTRRDKKAVHDILLNARVDFYADRPEGLRFVRRLFMGLMVLLALVICIAAGSFALINLKDSPPDPRLDRFEALNAEEPAKIGGVWREAPGSLIAGHMADFRCASRFKRFHNGLSCADQDFKSLVQSNREALLSYKQDIASTASDLRLHEKYLNFENVRLTDLALADLIIRQELEPDTRTFQEWLKLAKFWNDAIAKPGIMLAQSKALMHYNHTLLALPVLVNAHPESLAKYEKEIRQILTPLDFDRSFIEGLMAREYSVYNRIMSWSNIDYFPLIQPNNTRNYFIEATDALLILFDPYKDTASKQRALGVFEPRARWDVFYNPLGLRFRDLALQNIVSNLHVISTYHNNNFLKKMLLIYVDARTLQIPPENMGIFLNSLSKARLEIFYQETIKWDPELSALYYNLPGMLYRRFLII